MSGEEVNDVDVDDDTDVEALAAGREKDLVDVTAVASLKPCACSPVTDRVTDEISCCCTASDINPVAAAVFAAADDDAVEFVPVPAAVAVCVVVDDAVDAEGSVV